MPTPQFKRGDKGDKLTAIVNADLSGCVPPNGSVRWLARGKFSSEPPFELACSIVSTGETSTLEHTTDGTLDLGKYVSEIEATRGAEIFTFPTSTSLPEFEVVQDLG